MIAKTSESLRKPEIYFCSVQCTIQTLSNLNERTFEKSTLKVRTMNALSTRMVYVHSIYEREGILIFFIFQKNQIKKEKKYLQFTKQ